MIALEAEKKNYIPNSPDGTKISNPVDLEGLRRTSPSMRAAMNRVYHPLFFGFYDKTAGKVFKKFKTNKSKKVSGKDEKERKIAR